MKIKLVLHLCIISLLTLWQPAVARCGDIDCTLKQPYKGELFASLYKSTEKTAKLLCSALIASRIDPNAEFNFTLANFGKESEQALDNLNLSGRAAYKEQFSALIKTFSSFDVKTPLLPEFKYQRSVETGKPEGFFDPLAVRVDRFLINDDERCKTVSGGKSCSEIYKDFGDAFNPYRSGYNNSYDNTKQLVDLASSWDKFLETSKSQTFLEVLMTTWAHNDHFKKDFLVGPPSYQVIGLHPQLIYDTMSKATSGEQTEIGLAVEWLGVNFWDWKLPLGASFASAYVSRAGVNDVGHGIMLHIMNSYAVGWANRGGENSFYVTIDLLKMLQDKKKQYNKYVESYL